MAAAADTRRCRSSVTRPNDTAPKNTRMARIAASPPGQSAPAPSADQNVPNVESRRPDRELHRVFGDGAERPVHEHPDASDEHERRRRAGDRERERAFGAPEGDDDEDDLEPFEQHALERERERVPIEPGALDRRRGERRRQLPAERGVLIVERLVAARPEDRLSKPLEPEDEQERADDKPQRADRDQRQRRARRRPRSPRARASPRRPPPVPSANPARPRRRARS